MLKYKIENKRFFSIKNNLIMEHQYDNELLNRKYKVLKEVEEVEDGSSNILIIYLKGLFSFFEKIPQDYEHKERILYMC